MRLIKNSFLYALFTFGVSLGAIASASAYDNSATELAIAQLEIERASAQNKFKKPPVSEKIEVLRQAKSYAQSTACTTTFAPKTEDRRTDLTDVHLIESASSFNGNKVFGTKYIVYWRGDNACAGGSGTYMSFITSFERDRENGKFVVRERDIVDSIDSGNNDYDVNSRFIEAVSYNDGILSIISSDYGNDGSNSPRYKYLYSISYDGFGWRIADRELLEDLYLGQ